MKTGLKTGLNARRLATLLLTSFLVSSCTLPLPLSGSPDPKGHAWGYWRNQKLSNLHLELRTPSDGWETAVVTLIHPDPLTAPSRVTLVKDQDVVLNSEGVYKASNVFDTRLPATDGYTLVVSLWRGGVGNVLASEAAMPLSLRLGSTTAAVEVPEPATLALLGVDPASASPGSLVTLTGQGFSLLQEQNTVTLGGVSAQVVDASRDTLRVVVPEVAAGSYAWRVQVGSLITGRAGFIVP